MSVRKEQSLRELIVDNNWQQSASYYEAKRKSGQWFVLLYGQYTNKEDAQKDKSMLAKKLRIKDALIKKYDIFQQDIKSR